MPDFTNRLHAQLTEAVNDGEAEVWMVLASEVIYSVI